MDSRYTVKQALNKCEADIAGVAAESACFEARELVMKALGLRSRAELIKMLPSSMSHAQLDKLEGLALRRQNGEPLQYIIGEWEFMGLSFKTDKRALIPRQDTETLCEKAMELINKNGYRTLLDMCAGSGCIGISLAKPTGIECTLADISEAALSLCGENMRLNHTNARLIKTDLFENIAASYDIIVCNPPYLNDEDMRLMQKELEFEPENALYGGRDGLDMYRRIAAQYHGHVNKNGAILLEVGIRQAQAVAGLFGTDEIVKDLNGIDRVVIKR